MIRLFAALPVPPQIAQLVSSLQNGVPGARWSPAENLHITLRFFGELTETTAADLDEALAEIDGEGFDLALSGVGAFGPGEHMRAVWAGLASSEPLRGLAGRCERVARRCGLKAEGRTFHPHVTLAYLRHAPDPRVAAWVQAHNLLTSPPWRADGFGLYSSWRGSDGARYVLERRYLL